ncbi:hypothetical protein [Chromobacterium violaceum]|uniref:hypothetical protein n=1 Tax=Chromobacterium violaceum TaxID=536 RepID=UPI001CE1C422|nr:hypothetical protein [Chromobacterium violaceum]
MRTIGNMKQILQRNIHSCLEGQFSTRISLAATAQGEIDAPPPLPPSLHAHFHFLTPQSSGKDPFMNAAKKIRRFIEEGHDPQQMQVLKELAAALEMGRSFDLSLLYDIDMRYFDVAIDLLKDWRFDHHISSRSKLLEQLLTEIAPDQKAAVSAENVADATRQADAGKKKKS